MSDFDADDSSRNLLNKADEFLQRRRAQLGNPMRETAQHVAVEDDFPVLTDVVNQDGSAANITPTTIAKRDFSADIAREMGDWLDENLPQVVMHALDGITDRLIAQIHESAHSDLLPRLQRTLSEDKEPGADHE